MRFCGIHAVAKDLGVHPSSFRRWEENGLIALERVTMGKTTLRIYGEETIVNSIRISPPCLPKAFWLSDKALGFGDYISIFRFSIGNTVFLGSVKELKGLLATGI